MSVEHDIPTLLELKQFRLTFEKVKYTPGLTVDLANCVADEMNGGRLVYSQLIPLAGAKTINEALAVISKEIVPFGAREVLRLDHKGKEEITLDEWQTTDPNVLFVVSTRKNVKTWSLRNTEKKQNIIEKTAQKLHLHR